MGIVKFRSTAGVRRWDLWAWGDLWANGAKCWDSSAAFRMTGEYGVGDEQDASGVFGVRVFHTSSGTVS